MYKNELKKKKKKKRRQEIVIHIKIKKIYINRLQVGLSN